LFKPGPRAVAAGGALGAGRRDRPDPPPIRPLRPRRTVILGHQSHRPGSDRADGSGLAGRRLWRCCV